MPVVELLVSAFLPVLLERLTSPELLQFLRQEGLYSKIKEWEKMLSLIQEVLADAEEKQLTKTAVKTWLDDLRELAYDAEDMLDEFATEAIARNVKMKEQQASKVWKLVPPCFSNWSLGAIKFNIRMRSNVKDVTSRFDQLCKLRQDLGLKAITEGTSSSDAAPLRQPTSSQPIEDAVYGRDEDKKKILEMVLNDANFIVIPIVGMGGVGKTTLAREVFNDSEVESFEVKAWVCVSDGDFDYTRISKSILDNITGGSSSGQKDFDTVQKELKNIVNGKKFLLVLDDVWSVDDADWEILQSPFKAGALRSRIIVTTRLQEKALKNTPYGFHPLDVLSDGDCWSMFSKRAFKDNEANLAHRDMELVREKIIKMCKGLPLAAKTLGGLLGSQHIDGWLKILNSSLWDLSENRKSGIPAALKLSYHHLPSQLKRCFAYCAIFPKDYEFEEEELVLLWMAEGLIQQSTRNKQPEDEGREYFKDLLSRSMFQLSSSEYNSSKVVMHDLVHDMAEWAFGDTNIRLDGVLAADKQPRESKKVRHFSYTVDRYDGKNKFEFFHEARGLKGRVRTFLPIFERWVYDPYITNLVPSDLLLKLQRLRVLSLRSYHISEIPDSIGGLKHLRYLNLSETKIASLPESTCLLYNLQILMLRDCSRLAKLPSNFRYLTKLRHLDIRGAFLIEEMPLGMKELKSLQMLSDFIVGKGVSSNLKDLKSLKMLHGELRISRLDNVIDCDRANLILGDKKDLKELLLEWGSQFDDSRNEVVEKTVLDMLRPHQNLEKLTIICYGGTSFPSWVGHASFINNITVLTLQSCEKCTSLPSLGLLIFLKDLTIKGMKILQRIGCEIYGDEKPFQSLKTLCFEDLPEWENWEPNKENKYVNAFTCLQEFSIVNCPKLSRQLPDCLPSLEKFVIKRCEQLVISFSSLPLLCELEIDGCKGIVCNSPTDLKSLKSLTLADISGFGNWLRQQNFLTVECPKLKIMKLENLRQLNETFLQKPPQGLQNFISITELQIENCSNLVSFPEVCFLLNLSSLEIIRCGALTSLPKGMNDKNACLGSLKMQYCNSLIFIIRGKLPSSLKKLEIKGCEKLEYLWDDNEESCTSGVDEENPNNTNTSLLEYLHVDDCQFLKCLSSSGHLPQTLRTLSLFSLMNLESIAESFYNNKSLEEISVWYCGNLKSLPEGLHNLSHLQKIEIFSCGSIDCLGEEGPPNTNLSELAIFIIVNCKLKALPNWFHSLNSLKRLTLSKCQSMMSFPEEGFPTNLTYLEIDGLNVKMYKAVLEWGLNNLTSLTSLDIWGLPEAESFPHQELEMMFPPSLTRLSIYDFPNLKCLMGEGFRNLNSLDYLYIEFCPNLTSFPEIALPSSLKSLSIKDCPNLTSFPEIALPSSLKSLSIEDCPNLTSFPEIALPSSLKSLSIKDCRNLKSFSKLGLPSSLLQLDISFCPQLKEECKRDKGNEWSKISHIPCVRIDHRYIYDP